MRSQKTPRTDNARNTCCLKCVLFVAFNKSPLLYGQAFFHSSTSLIALKTYSCRENLFAATQTRGGVFTQRLACFIMTRKFAKHLQNNQALKISGHRLFAHAMCSYKTEHSFKMIQLFHVRVRAHTATLLWFQPHRWNLRPNTANGTAKNITL